MLVSLCPNIHSVNDLCQQTACSKQIIGQPIGPQIPAAERRSKVQSIQNNVNKIFEKFIRAGVCQGIADRPWGGTPH